MKLRAACLVLVLVLAASVASASREAPKPTRAQLRAKITQQAKRITTLTASLADAQSALGDARAALADTRDTLANVRDQRDAQDAVIANQNATITRLQARDPLDAVLARDADGKWQAMLALWRAFPSLSGTGVFCGYDKSTAPLGAIGLVATTYTFYLWSGC